MWDVEKRNGGNLERRSLHPVTDCSQYSTELVLRKAKNDSKNTYQISGYKVDSVRVAVTN